MLLALILLVVAVYVCFRLRKAFSVTVKVDEVKLQAERDRMAAQYQAGYKRSCEAGQKVNHVVRDGAVKSLLVVGKASMKLAEYAERKAS